jgi:deoxyribodipyrimidine photo-lyase
MDAFGIHWFRRDLRIAGNHALKQQVDRHKGRVVGVFTFDDRFLSRPDFSHNRFQFFLKTLSVLRDDLRRAGGDLLVLSTSPDDGFKLIKERLQRRGLSPGTVSWSRDYEPYARERDSRLQSTIQSWGWDVLTERDHLLIEPHEITSQQGTPFKIYSPFAKRWFALFHTDDIRERVLRQRAGLTFLDLKAKGKEPKVFHLTWKNLLGDDCPEDHLERFLEANTKHVTIPIPDAGPAVAWAQIRAFSGKLASYGETRDFMAVDGTSKLSMFLKNGTITVPQIIAAYDLMNLKFNGDDGATKYLKELVWREFYYHVMWHWPNAEHEAFIEKYRNLAWDNDESLFDAWKQGKTGYPIVDAAMRELLTTGWMHNRARMIVASFLTKDLLIDWRWGEKWFMNQLLDGDLAPNNGGWQWAASTGCDPQPYFRIFNPLLQSERFDADGHYIRAFIPELKGVPTKEIHNPSSATRKRTGYPEPIVNHAEQKIRASMLFKMDNK